MSIDQYFRRLNELEGVSPSVGRRSAMSIPAVLRGRNLICNIGTLPLVTYRGNNEVMRHLFLEQIDPRVANVVTLQQTVEDLVMDSVSFWRITQWDWKNYPVSAYHVNLDSVTVQAPTNALPTTMPCGDSYHPDGEIYIEGVKVSSTEIIRFDSPHPPLRKTVGGVIRRAMKTAKTSEMFAENPMPKLLFTPKADVDPLFGYESPEEARAAMQEEIQAFADSAKNNPYNYVGAALDAKPLDYLSPADLQLIEVERNINLGIANALGLDPEDLGISTTSRTYQNAVDRRKDRINDLLNPYILAVEQRLTMPDVTPRGYFVKLLQDDYLRADPKTRAEIHQIYLNSGVITKEEVRSKEGWAPFTPEQKAELEQAQREAVKVQSTLGNSPRELEAGRPADYSFATSSDYTFDNEERTAFAVNKEARTITGLALPYGKTAVSRGRKWEFLPGSLEYADLSRVKLLRDHDNSSAIGIATGFVETERGVEITFKVAPGEKGNEALSLAEFGVLDGLSVGTTDMDFYNDPQKPGVNIVRKAHLNEVSLTAVPAFDDSRLTSVTAAKEGNTMICTRCGQDTHVVENCTAPDPEQQFSIKDFEKYQRIQAMFNQTVDEAKKPLQNNAPASVQDDPTVPPREVPNAATFAQTVVNEKPVYTFDTNSEFSFANDIKSMLKGNDEAARKRVEGFMEAEFAVSTSNVATLNPTIQRPDMYVDRLDYEYPIWNTINKGAPPNGVTPFQFPKWSSSGTLVADHTEGTEPSLGSFAVTSQTVTPTPLSGKIEINREAWDQMGSPNLDNLVRAEMRRSWYEGLETATAAFLDGLTLTGQETTITTAAADTALQGELIGALVDMLFTRGGYRLRDFMVQANLYKKLALAKDGNGRLLFPPLAPQNAAGTLASFFANLNLNGLIGRPAWALGAASTNADNSYLFAREDVHGWATTPQFLEFNIQVKSIYIGVWGYKAFANSRVEGIRRFIYDPA
ncbi:phage portal protein [Actinoplanes sp. NPDC049596]|uniref:phage portal protein n=1 Tax=unclassified Actinoplanes TaxID=2626549 RepID=UPI00343D31E5